jgi:Oxysterol-binding protein
VRLQAKFHDGELVSWNKVTSTINNLILGKINIEHGGTMKVTSSVERDEMRIKFKDGGMFGSKRTVTGSIMRGGTDTGEFKCALLVSFSFLLGLWPCLIAEGGQFCNL